MIVDRILLEKEACKRSLSTFVKESWNAFDPSPYVHGWHVDALAEHLEAAASGEINRLLINIPPGTAKSTICSIMFPAWLWGPKGRPESRIIGASHAADLAVRDSVRTRRLIQSDWYRERWPIEMTSDNNQKTYFENKKAGFRQACSVTSMTGRRGDYVIWDDPSSSFAANSKVERDNAINVFAETLPTRLNNPEKSVIIVIMQRLHEEDISGYILSNDFGYTHLNLPMRFEPERKCTTSIGWTDPRKEDGDLLFPARFPAHVVDRDEKVMGAYAFAGQMQQRPAPRTGGFFAWENFKMVKAAPRMITMVRYWDKGGTDDGGCYTAGVLIGKCEAGLYYVIDVVRGQWSALKREQVILQTAAIDGHETKIWIEQEPGSGGKESAETTTRQLAGYLIHSERPTGSKEARAEPYQIQIEAGNVHLVEGDWTKDFIDEHKTFPTGKYKDQVDAAAGAFVKAALASVFNLDNL